MESFEKTSINTILDSSFDLLTALVASFQLPFDFEVPASIFLTSVPTSLRLSFLASVGLWTSSFLFKGEDDEGRRIRAGLLTGAAGARFGLLEGLLLLVLLMCLNLIFLLAINLSLQDLSSVKLIPTLDPSQTPLRLSSL